MGVKDIFKVDNNVTKPEEPVVKPDPKDVKIEELESDLKAIRKCVTCVICQDMLFEPYSLQCGHVFCYTCLLDWLGHHKKRTCPECRAVVSNQPAPAYLIRDMIETFIVRAEKTVPKDAGIELRERQKEAINAVERDRATEGTRGGGLFRAMFKPRRKYLQAMRDPEDGILRCPECNWEVVDGHCGRCGRRVRDRYGGHEFSDGYDTEESDSEAEEEVPSWDEEVDEDEEADEDDVARVRGPRQIFFANYDPEEDDDDDDVTGMREGGRNVPISVDDDDDDDEDDSDLSVEVTYTNRSRAVAPVRNGRRPPVGVSMQAREDRSGRRPQESSEIDEDEEDSDEDEGSLEDFVVHDTPENRRRRVGGNNRNGGVAVNNGHGFPSSGPVVISSSPVVAAPTRRNVRNTRNARRTVTDTDEESSAVSEASSRPPPFLGDIRHDYNHRRGPIALPSDNDEEEEELLGPGMGYTPLEHTASENEDDGDGFSSPPVRTRRRQPGRGGPGSVFSVPEEDEEDDESRGFGDDDESEDQDGDVRMSGQTQRRMRSRTSRPQAIDDDSDSDSDVAPAPRRRRTQQSGNYFRAHHHNTNTNNTRRHRDIVPTLFNAFQQHAQAMTDRQLDNLGLMNSARSVTPVQRHFTGGSNRGARSTRESTADSTWEVTPMRQSSSPPPFSPMFQGVSSSPAPMQPNSPGAYPQSPASPRMGAGVRAGSESSSVWSPSSPQPQQQRPPQLQQPRSVPITIGSSPQPTRVRTRNSRQQLRGASSRAGLRVGSITPTPTNPSVTGTTSRQTSATPSAASAASSTTAGRTRRGVLTTEDIRARGEAAMRQRQQEAAAAANGLGRRLSRRDLTTGNNNNAPPLSLAGRTGSGFQGQGRRLGAVIGGPPGGVTAANAGGGPMLVIGSEDD